MQLYSSSPNPKFTLLPLSNSCNTNSNPSKFQYVSIPYPKILNSSSSHVKLPPCFSKEPSLDEKLLCNDSDDEYEESKEDDTIKKELLTVRKPVMEFPVEEEEEEADNDDSSVSKKTNEDEIEVKEEVEEDKFAVSSTSSVTIDAGLSDFAKKMPIFEPETRVQLTSEKKPLGINLELALYRAKVLARNFKFQEATEILQKCISFWPEDGRIYVALGKVLSKQSKTDEARITYEKGCQATQGENPYIWQCWAVLESKMGNVRKARELFDAATVADKKHVAAWHGWAVLELKQGNINKARNLLGKGIKYCGGNEYIYQTLALLEAKANRIEQARYLFKQATNCNPKSCASWLAWAQLEMQRENNRTARQLFEKAVQASPKNRFAWHVWGIFEANLGDIEIGRKLLKIGHALNPRDPVLLQSLALLEYKYSTANLARVLFRRASELDPRHQPVWIAWGWMEWKEGNISKARELYQRALSIDSTTESAARCLQAWGVLEQRIGNMSAARRLFRSSLNINSQSYVTWMTWGALEEDQGNFIRAEEIRDLYFQQRTEVVDDASWVMGFMDIIDPTLDRIKRFLNLENSQIQEMDSVRNIVRTNRSSIDDEDFVDTSSSSSLPDLKNEEERSDASTPSSFDLDGFIKRKLSLDVSRLDFQIEASRTTNPTKVNYSRNVWRPEKKTLLR
ncbi:protein high chlorophyll fluorescent 107-like [Papaver somniferum]|uniref:protein high chlorophyll fluorescent 107-like n=1 Tax=Papaver somniferum TaxID=3469 RepID=UPI000E6F77AC|nr:protein high chlorophyll fluorescent 107-like [Papaver somniferum]